MKGRLREWCDDAWAAVQETPGGIGAELRARWEAHASRDHVVVTFFGPYDSGKSSLLKRLLVDDGKPVPDWLTVSGRRETFEPKEVFVAGLVVRDTPGIAGGNELHDAIAKEALLLSDAIALVLPPQLVTSDRESLVSVFSGRRFGCAARFAFPERGLPIALSRMDEAGAMPRDDSQGYRDLVERKRKELSDLLRSEGGAEEVVVLHAVAADPFGLVGNAQPSGPEEYDADRSGTESQASPTFSKRSLPVRTCSGSMPK
ncbi:MAG: GTPase domain-containing protein [Deltaproteobacteria bacterium]|nr:GTPase domain-containing protein [Deltaproteobacteria bacterium]